MRLDVVLGGLAVQGFGLLLVLFLHLAALFFFSFQDVLRDELHKLLVEDIQDPPTEELELVCLAWEVIVQDLHERGAKAAVLWDTELEYVLLLVFRDQV